MKLLPHILTLLCIGTTLISNADEQVSPNTKCAAKPPTAGEFQILEGKWEGVEVGEASQKKITITITNGSLHFFRDTNFWFDTTITLPPLTFPRQLHAKIKNSSPPTNSIGEVVRAIFKIEAGTLTLATGGDSEDGTPKSFEPTEAQGVTLYELRRTQPQQKNTQPPESK
ncbi:MAG: hypothetical protein JNK85_11490 [Verrucomicrobiales bacterium]|nr:hypothetical protein [Verrucomicrobiales bacterium]